MSNLFWDKVIKCNHDNISEDYFEIVYCPTPYCSGYEVHCLECGAFITKCDCGFCNGISGWSEKRWRKFDVKKKNINQVS